MPAALGKPMDAFAGTSVLKALVRLRTSFMDGTNRTNTF